MKILLDTDIGSDIDDAVCLAYLLANPECDILGITTVSGEAEKRAMMASALCNVAGRRIPVLPGIEKPLIIEQKQTKAEQASALDKWKHEKNFKQGEAINFLRSVIRQNPDEIIMLTIGPLTNIGLLFSIDPEIPSLLKGLVMMAGVFTGIPQGYKLPLEWNVICDPHSAGIVYKSKVKMHRSVGLDVTTKVAMDAGMVREKFKHELFKPVLDFAQVWFDGGRKQITFHDPLAAVAVFDGEVCGFERGEVEVELSDVEKQGMTKWKVSPSGSHEIAVSVDADRFFEKYFSVF